MVTIHPIYACCFGVIMTGAPFHSQKCPSLDDYSHLQHCDNRVLVTECKRILNMLRSSPEGSMWPKTSHTESLLLRRRRGRRSLQWEGGGLGGSPAAEACAFRWAGTAGPGASAQEGCKTQRKSSRRTLASTTLHTQPLSPEPKNITFSKKIRVFFFTSIMSLPSAHSCPYLHQYYQQFYHVNWFQVLIEGWWVCLILNLEQKNKRVDEKQK